MKKLYLLFSQMFSHFRNNKVIFIIFFSTSILCSMAFLYAYGNLVGYIGLRSSEERYWREYQIRLDETDTIDVIIDKLSRLQNENIEDIALCNSLSKSGNIVLYASLNESGVWHQSRGRISFNDEEILNGKNVVIVPRTYDAAEKTFSVNGIKYSVIGAHSSSAEFRIPLKSFIDNSYVAKYATIITKTVPNAEMNQEITDEIRALFPESSLYISYRYIDAEIKRMPSQILILSLMYGVSILSFIFLLKYMIENSYGDLVLYGIVGASKFQIALFVMLEMLLLSITTSLIAVLLHILLYDVLISKINYVDSIYYTFKDYSMIFIINVVVMQLMNIPFIASIYRNSTSQAKRKYIGE